MLAHKKEDKHLEKDKDLSNKQESKSGKSESSTSPPHDDRKHGSRFTSPIHYIYVGPFSSVFFSVSLLISSFSHLEAKSPGKMMQINARRDSLLNMRPFRRGRYFDKVRRFLCLFNFAVFTNHIRMHFARR